jgi:hypothetical protein
MIKKNILTELLAPCIMLLAVTYHLPPNRLLAVRGTPPYQGGETMIKKNILTELLAPCTMLLAVTYHLPLTLTVRALLLTKEEKNLFVMTCNFETLKP